MAHPHQSGPPLKFEGMIGYAVAEAEEAEHFFEHTLGLPPGIDDGALRLYQLSDDLTLVVDVTGAMNGAPPYMIFSTPNITEAAEHFLQRGCQVGELPWASGNGFVAKSAEGHVVCIVDAAAFED